MLTKDEITAIHERWKDVELDYKELVISDDGLVNQWQDKVYTSTDFPAMCVDAQIVTGDQIVLVYVLYPTIEQRNLLSSIAHSATDVHDLLHFIGNIQHVAQGVDMLDKMLTKQEGDIASLNLLVCDLQAQLAVLNA